MEPGNSAALADALAWCADNTDAATAIGLAAKSMVEKDFSIDRMPGALIAVTNPAIYLQPLERSFRYYGHDSWRYERLWNHVFWYVLFYVAAGSWLVWWMWRQFNALTGRSGGVGKA